MQCIVNKGYLYRKIQNEKRLFNPDTEPKIRFGPGSTKPGSRNSTTLIKFGLKIQATLLLNTPRPLSDFFFWSAFVGVPFADATATAAAGVAFASDISSRRFWSSVTLIFFVSRATSFLAFTITVLVACFALALFGFDLGNVYIWQGAFKMSLPRFYCFKLVHILT